MLKSIRAISFFFNPLGWIKMCSSGPPWWLSGWESTCQCRGHGFERWSRKIPHVTEQLSLSAIATEPAVQSPRATTTEARMPQLVRPARLEPVLHSKRSHHNGRLAHCSKEWPPLAATRESPQAAARTQHSQKKKTTQKNMQLARAGWWDRQVLLFY